MLALINTSKLIFIIKEAASPNEATTTEQNLLLIPNSDSLH